MSSFRGIPAESSRAGKSTEPPESPFLGETLLDEFEGGVTRCPVPDEHSPVSPFSNAVEIQGYEEFESFEDPVLEAEESVANNATLEEAELALLEEDESGASGVPDRTLRIAKRWRRPPFPRRLKIGIMVRGVARVNTYELLGWFQTYRPPSHWVRMLDANLIQVAPKVDVTLEIFKRVRLNLSEPEISHAIRRYLDLRHLSTLKATPFWTARRYGLRVTALSDRLGVDLGKLAAVARIKGIPDREIDKYFVLVYASFPAELKQHMVPETRFTLDRFAVDSFALIPEHRDEIDRIARLVVSKESGDQPIRTLRFMGHTDSTGTQSYNVGLGGRRAMSVKAALEAAVDRAQPGLAAKMVSIFESLGEQSPAMDNSTEDARELNRRVDIYVARLGAGHKLTGGPNRVKLEETVRRGLGLMKDPARFKSQITDETAKRFACILRRTFASDADDRFVDASLAAAYYNTGRPVLHFSRMADDLTLKSGFGPDVSDEAFVGKLLELDERIVSGMTFVRRMFDQHGSTVANGLRFLREWMRARAIDDVSIYRCYSPNLQQEIRELSDEPEEEDEVEPALIEFDVDQWLTHATGSAHDEI